jgi:hypothetical protein
MSASDDPERRSALERLVGAVHIPIDAPADYRRECDAVREESEFVGGEGTHLCAYGMFSALYERFGRCTSPIIGRR